MQQTRNSTVFSAALVLSALAGTAAGKQLSMDYSFDRPEVSKVAIEGKLYDRVTMPDVPNCGNAGQPALPAKGARILLPFGSEISSIEIVPGERVSLGSGYLIEPVSRPVPLSAGPGAAMPPTPDPAIYDSDRSFPETRFVEVGTHAFRGYQILILKLQPVEYVPTSGELYYYPHLTVVVDTVDADNPLSLFRGLEEDKAQVLAKVDNPEVAETYAAAGMRGGKSYDLLIITTPSLAGAFQPLKTHHDANGILTEIHTTTDVGSSDPDDVRDYIRDRYDNDGIEYVIIGADDDIIPAKDLYVKTDPGGGHIEYNMPADIYFACLDGTYNYDGDSYWGEPTDGEGGGDVDLVAEVYVGRASVGNTTEATRFVDKTIWYLTNQHSQPAEVLLVGEYLGFGGDSEYAAKTLEELIDGCSTHGYTTVGIPSDMYDIDELFERDWPGNDWPQSELVTRINDGLHFLNHLGHGGPDYAMKLYNSHVLSLLTNDDLCLVYSQTCSAGRFDGTDCWAETANIKTDYGAFAVIMNARYGFGDWNTTDGPSQRFNREFWDAVFNQAEAKAELGRANQDSKEDNLYRINEDCMRWITYELNLFGDPTVALREVTGLRVTPETELVSEGPGGGPFTPSSIVYTLENMGPAAISYEVTKTTSWLTITNGSGTLNNVGDTVDVTVSINSDAESLPDGMYYDTVNFINMTDHVGNTTRDVTLKVGVPVLVYEWPLDVNPGWSIEGEWEFGPATAGGSNNGDPGYAYTGTNVYGYNLGGDYPDNLPAMYLTTEAIDCTGLSDVTLKFRRWLGVESNSHYDEATIEASNNGSDWTVFWRATDLGVDVADVTWQLHEVNISSIADDELTVYVRWGMGPTDGGVTFPGWNIDDVQIVAIGGEPPALFILLPDGVPQYLTPGVPATFAVQILDGDESYVPGSGMLYYRYGGGTYLTSPLAHIGGNLYEATLPGAGCSATPEFYISAEGDGGATVSNPRSAPTTVFTADVGTFTTVMEDNFETDQGWTAENLGATSGDWQRGVPVNDPSWDYDPESDSDGSGQCFLTQNQMGNTDVDDGAVRLTSPTIDMSGGDITISYDYYLFLTNADGGVDRLLVEIDSNDGAGPWIEIARHDSNGGLNWRHHIIQQADLNAAGVTLTSTMKLRFTANDADPQSINESGLDAFLITAFECISAEEPVITTQPASQTACIDESATFTIEVTGMPSFSYQWKYNGGDIPDANDSSYTINNVSVDDAGAYSCEVTNDFGTVLSDEAMLAVLTSDDCDDGNACTADSCANGVCINTDTTPEGQCCDPLTGDLTEIDDDNACTDDICNPDGTVDHVDNFDPQTECCDPATGGTTLIDDGSDCTIDECDPLTGIVEHTVLMPGAAGEGGRSLSITPQPCSDSVALFVTSPTYPCLAKYVNAEGRLVDSPVWQTPSAWDTVDIRSDQIIPSSTYTVQAEHENAGLSEGTTATTWAWGDVDDNDVVNVTDVLLIIAAFQGDFTNATLEAVDLHPCEPDLVIGLGDILAAIGAYQGQTYADTGCPIPCAGSGRNNCGK